MKKYFILRQQKPVGPFSFDELIQNGIKQDELIWFVGLETWVKAREIQELSGYFDEILLKEKQSTKINEMNFPPIPNELKPLSGENNNKNQAIINNEIKETDKSNRKLITYFITIGFLFILFLIIFFIAKKCSTPSPEEIAAKEQAIRDSIIYSTLMNDNQNTTSNTIPNNNVANNKENELGKRYEGTYISSYVYSGSECNSTLEIKYLNSGAISFKIFTGCAEGCSGDISGTADFSSQFEANYVDSGINSDCRLRFIFNNNKVKIPDDCSYYHGMSCTFSGDYIKQ